MDEAFKIYTEQLRDGRVEKVAEEFHPDFLDICEKDLAFKDKILVNGDAYLAADTLVLHLAIIANAVIPCIICNQPVVVKLKIENLYHAEPLEEIKTGVFNFRELLREAVLLEVPTFAECNGGTCPDRELVKQYLKSSQSQTGGGDIEDGYQPFADLNIDKSN